MMAPTATVKHVVVAALLEGRWVETEYEVSDRRWHDAIRALRDIGTRVRMFYKP